MVAQWGVRSYKINILLHMLPDETFALVVMTTTVLTTIALVACHSQPLYQMDVKNVFLYEDQKRKSISILNLDSLCPRITLYVDFGYP